jgi:hypothetical protein
LPGILLQRKFIQPVLQNRIHGETLKEFVA